MVGETTDVRHKKSRSLRWADTQCNRMLAVAVQESDEVRPVPVVAKPTTAGILRGRPAAPCTPKAKRDKDEPVAGRKENLGPGHGRPASAKKLPFGEDPNTIIRRVESKSLKGAPRAASASAAKREQRGREVSQSPKHRERRDNSSAMNTSSSSGASYAAQSYRWVERAGLSDRTRLTGPQLVRRATIRSRK